MKIAAVLGVKDEVELIEQCIAHLREIGVDHIIACDDASTDGTAEILRRYESPDSFWYASIHDWPGDHQGISNQYIKLFKRFDADWVLFLDADEFWIPASGSLKSTLSLLEYDVLSVTRFNVPMGPENPLVGDSLRPSGYDELMLLTSPLTDIYDLMQQGHETPWIQGAIMPKVIARKDIITRVSPAGHDVGTVDPSQTRNGKANDIVIAHLPFTSRERFYNKVRNVRTTIQAYPEYFTGRVGWHWRRWADLYKSGHIDEEFDRQLLSIEMIKHLRNKNRIMSVRELFYQWMSQPSKSLDT